MNGVYFYHILSGIFCQSTKVQQLNVCAGLIIIKIAVISSWDLLTWINKKTEGEVLQEQSALNTYMLLHTQMPSQAVGKMAYQPSEPEGDGVALV